MWENPRPVYTNELYHHGIIGQHWGVRNGPPYPLESTHRDRIRRTEKDVKTILEIQKWDDNKLKDTVKSLVKNKQYKDAIGLANSRARNAILKARRSNEKIDPKSGCYLKNRSSSMLRDAKNVNPSYKDTTTSSQNNCLLCTVAYDLRRRGYDAVSKQHAKIDLLYDIGEKDVAAYYPGLKFKTFPKEKGSLNGALTSLKKEPNNSRGYLSMQWSKNAGHVVAYEIKNNKIFLVDSQSGDIYSYSKNGMPNIFKGALSAKYARLDNLDPNWRTIWEAIE